MLQNTSEDSSPAPSGRPASPKKKRRRARPASTTKGAAAPERQAQSPGQSTSGIPQPAKRRHRAAEPPAPPSNGLPSNEERYSLRDLQLYRAAAHRTDAERFKWLADKLCESRLTAKYSELAKRWAAEHERLAMDVLKLKGRLP